MAVVVERVEDLLGLRSDEGGLRTVMHRTQPEGVRSGPGDIDRTVFSLRRFIRLAVSGNPSVLMVLWAPVIDVTTDGEQLRALGSCFIGRHVIPRYRGYMQGQALRLFGLRGSSGHGRRAGARSELVTQHGYDTKYAMHCARLGFQCVELLTTGRLTLPIPGKIGEWLTAVRRGDVPFDEWWERALSLDSQLAQIEHDASIRAGPDADAIEAWSIATHLRHWC